MAGAVRAKQKTGGKGVRKCDDSRKIKPLVSRGAGRDGENIRGKHADGAIAADVRRIVR